MRQRFRKPLLLLMGFVVVTVVLLVAMVLWSDGSTATEDSTLDCPTITTAEGLRQALRKPTRRYLVDGLTLEGEGVTDRLAILSAPCLVIDYEGWQCQYDDDADAPVWVRTSALDETARTDAVTVAGVSMDASACDFRYNYNLSLDESNTQPSAWEHLLDGRYYPFSQKTVAGNVAYVLGCVPVGARVIFFADIGDGVLSPASVSTNDARQIVIVNGDMSDLRYYITENHAGGGALFLFVLFPADVVLLVWAIWSFIKAARRHE